MVVDKLMGNYTQQRRMPDAPRGGPANRRPDCRHVRYRKPLPATPAVERRAPVWDHGQMKPSFRRRRHRTGLWLCGAYACLVLLCAATWRFADLDTTGAYLVLQAPVMLQHAALLAFGLGPVMARLGWIAYFMLITLTCAGLYAIGRAHASVTARDQ